MTARQPWLTPDGRAPRARKIEYLDDEVWFERTGKVAPPSQMDTRHLINTVRFVERQAVGYVISVNQRRAWEAAQGDEHGFDVDENAETVKLEREIHFRHQRYQLRPTPKRQAKWDAAIEACRVYVMGRPLVRAMLAEIGRRTVYGEPAPARPTWPTPTPEEFERAAQETAIEFGLQCTCPVDISDEDYSCPVHYQDH